MALASKNPFTDMTRTHTRFASTLRLQAASVSSCSLLPAQRSWKPQCPAGEPFASHCDPKNTSDSAKTTAPQGIERERCLSLAGACQVSDEPHVSEREPGANTLRKTEVWLLLAETFLDHLVSSRVSETPWDPTCNCNVGRKAAREGLWEWHCHWGGK